MAAGDAHPIPKKNAAYRITVPMFDNTGALLTGGLTGLAATRSLDAANFAATTNAPAEIGVNGSYVTLDLTAAEMNTNTTAIKITATNANARPTTVVLNPQTVGDISVDLTSIDSQPTVSNSATLNLKQLNVQNNAGSAILAASTGGNGHGIAATGQGTGSGIFGTAGGTGKICNLLDTLEGTEPAGAIANNASFASILQYHKRRFFGKVTQTVTTQTVFKDDGTTTLTTMPVSDDGTTQSKGKSV